MRVEEIKKIASDKGVKAGKMKKGELIRAIQVAEGNTPCYATSQSAVCGQNGCLWREDCS